MMPAAICMHWEPALRRRCTAGLDAPRDCGNCPAYHDGLPYLGFSPADQARSAAWDKARDQRVNAHFRGQP